MRAVELRSLLAVGALVGLLTVGVGVVPASADSCTPGVDATLDVSDFGFDADAIQCAHDTLPLTGGELYFPAGVYMLDGVGGADAVEITTPDVTLRGDGYDSKLVVDVPAAAIFYGMIVTGEGATMRDLMLIGDGESNGLSMTVKWRSSGSLIEDCWFDLGGYASLEVGFASEVMVRNNSFKNAIAAGAGYGIAIVNAAEDLVIRDNYFYRHRHAIAHGMYTAVYPGAPAIEPPTNIYIVNNVIEQVPGQTGEIHRAAIEAHPRFYMNGSWYSPDGTIYILGNEISNSSKWGIEINGMRGVIRDNYIHDNDLAGIYFSAEAQDWLVADNTVVDNGYGIVAKDETGGSPAYANGYAVDVLRGTFSGSNLDEDIHFDESSSTSLSVSGASYGTIDTNGSAALLRSRVTAWSDSAVSVPTFGLAANNSNVLSFDVKDSLAANSGLLGYWTVQAIVDGEVVWSKDLLGDGTDWGRVSVNVIRQIAGKKEFTVSFRLSLNGSISNFPADAYIDDVELGDAPLDTGGFETTSDWSFTNSGGVITGARDSAVKNEGTYSYRISYPTLTPGSTQYGQVTQAVEAYHSQVLKFQFKDAYAANGGLTGYYTASVLIDGQAVWSLDPLTTGTSWTQYTVDIGRQLAWAPSYTLSLQATQQGNISNFEQIMNWDDVKLNDVLVPSGDFESIGSWGYTESADGYWSGTQGTTSPYAGTKQYEFHFPANQASNTTTFGRLSQVLR